jgi:hypothetical protein
MRTWLKSLERKGLKNSLLTKFRLVLPKSGMEPFFDREGDLRETDDLRVLDEDGDHVFKLFRFDEFGSSLVYEPPQADN